jgi:trehalose 6-phosphate phosphatase
VTDRCHDPRDLATELDPAEAHLVVIDFDGTVSPIVDHPDDARPAPGALDALTALTRRTAVALVSGRPARDLRDRLEGLPVTIAGGHGAELLEPDGAGRALIDPAAVGAVLDDLEARIRALVDDEPGWLVERKTASLAVHHRLAPADDVERILPRVEALLEAGRDAPPGFEVLAGKAVVELRPAGIDKGGALDLLVERHPGLKPLVIGDDITDEDLFEVARERGGTAILVADVPRPTAASHRLADPAAVVRFLAALAGTPSEH